MPWMRLGLLLAALLYAGGSSASELVRVRVSQFAGDEPATLSSGANPTLFVLDPRIASAELTVVNETMLKNDRGPGTWFPSLAPVPPANDAGYIQLTVTPVGGQAVSFGAVQYLVSGPFPGNPTSLVLRWSKDAFAAPLRVIDTSDLVVETVGLSSAPSDAATSFRWVAGNDFGEGGGAEVGFASDLVVYAATCPEVPSLDCEAPGRASLQLEGTPGRERLAWSWSGGDVAPMDLASPSADGLFALCLWDARGLVYEAVVGPERCGAKDCWKIKTKDNVAVAFSYKKKAGNADGLSQLKIKTGEATGAFALRGRGAALGLPLPLFAGPGTTVQLLRSDREACWDSFFEPPAEVNGPLEFEDSIP